MPENKMKKAFSDGDSNTSEPVAKRTRAAENKIAASKSREGCIHILNEDCWRVVLDYVELYDLVRSETVSKQWRLIVHQYIQGVRLCLRVKMPDPVTIPTTRQWHVTIVKGRNLNVIPKYHVPVIEKYGRAIVAADCVDGPIMTALEQHCPDLADLRVIDPQCACLKRRGHFKKLRRLSFHNVIMFRDAHISKHISRSIEEFTIIHNLKTTGLCLKNLTTNLKRLSLSYCYMLNTKNLLSAPLADLTRLDLLGNHIDILEDAYKFIEKAPKLEYLGLKEYSETEVGGLGEAICGLERLKHLNFYLNASVDDSLMEVVGRCRELRTVNVGDCENLTSAGIVALCRGAGKTLTSLVVTGNHYVTDDDMALCVSCCPRLEYLDVRNCEQMTPCFPADASRVVREGGAGGERGAGRRGERQLRLKVSPAWTLKDYWLPDYLARPVKRKKKYDNLILEDDEW